MVSALSTETYEDYMVIEFYDVLEGAQDFARHIEEDFEPLKAEVVPHHYGGYTVRITRPGEPFRADFIQAYARGWMHGLLRHKRAE